MEVVKTRMQMQGELVARNQTTKVYRNALHCFYRVTVDEGLRGIQSGLKAGIVYQVLSVADQTVRCCAPQASHSVVLVGDYERVPAGVLHPN